MIFWHLPQGQHTKAHKMILCACSPYFKNLLEQNPAKHPIIILKDVPFAHLTAILEFMYAGEVSSALICILTFCTFGRMYLSYP